MAIDLKAHYAAVQAADAAVTRILDEMKDLLAQHTPEGERQAMAMRPALKAAQIAAKDARTAYQDLMAADFYASRGRRA